MNKTILILVLSFLYFHCAFSQEGLRPLHGNINYAYKTIEHSINQQSSQLQDSKKTSIASLYLPFKEDFYYATTNKYPDPNLWLDSNVFVNTGFPIAPPSIGVATFDGLNKHGYPYNPNLLNLTQSLSADTLTSREINLALTSTNFSLQPSDSIAISFYYQARGNGEAPEINDILALDFYMPAANTWSNVWSVNGNNNSNTNDTVFKRGFVWINNNVFLKDGFKFRFRNTATTCGDFDHWNLDYIYLDKNRSEKGDTVYNDLTFANVPTPLLKNYSAMPFEQYASKEMANKISVRIKNNYSDKRPISYDLKILNSTKQQLHQYAGGPTNICPFKPYNVSGCTGTSGYSQYQFHSNPAFNYTFSSLTDSMDFTIKHFLSRSSSTTTGNSTDDFPENDTLLQFQKFRNYYALDDGSAEGGYYINGVGGKMAIKFTINYTDTLQAVRIYFDPVGNVPSAQTGYSFNIILWDDGISGPGNVIFTESVNYPKYYNTGFREHPEYSLTASKALRTLGTGNYYIGFQQKIASGITVGFDKNIDHHDMVYYDSGSGWTQSQIPGSLMIHPVLGRKLLPPVGLSERSKIISFFNVYPNPSHETLSIKSDRNGEFHYQLFDALGRTILQSNFDELETTINTLELSNGIYFLTVSEKNTIIHQQKIIVQH